MNQLSVASSVEYLLGIGQEEIGKNGASKK
jgi:hypothetical protein